MIPRSDQLLSLIQFNVFRAMILNFQLIGLDLEYICDDDSISPFGTILPDRGCTSLPPSLRPTSLQRAVIHHPWIDFFPVHEVRDNLIRAGNSYDDEELCIDLMGFCNAPSEKTGLIVWGEPWNCTSWEVTSEFAQKWGWVVRGCTDLIASTNYWRAQRGENPILF
jgi:hypothetical protein